jgi:N-methylhydantoinase B
MTPAGDEARSVDIDPITFAVFLNRLAGIATEMTISLETAAMTSILALARDYSCCVYDRQLRQVAMVDAIPIHTNAMQLLLEAIADRFEDDLHEGDVIGCNYA